MSGSNDNSQCIVITGQGLVTPLGRSAETVVDNWMNGRSAAAPITALDATNLPVRIACEIADFEPRKEIRNRKLLRLLMRGEDYGMVAAAAALENAGLGAGDYDPSRAGIAVGIRKEGFRNRNFDDAINIAIDDEGRIDRRMFIEEGMRRVPPQTIVEGLANAGIYHIAHEHLLQGFNLNWLAVGSGGFQAIGEAMWALRRDEADLILAGAFDSWLNWNSVSFTHFIGIASPSADAPETVHRPFDVSRTGSVIGEGAALFVMESRERAEARGASILGEVRGMGMATGVPSSDPAACANALASSIRRSLEVARLTPDDIDLIHLHGDATIAGDRAEVRGLCEAFGDRAPAIPATTVKSATGFMANASASVEVAAVLEVMRRGEIPPIVNLTTPDPDCNLRFVREPLSESPLRHALLIERSWPSQYVSLVVSRTEPSSL